MSESIVTQQNLIEAGIAAAIVANSNMLPPEISELSDQAAVFASDSTAAFKFTGGADADSTSTNFGLSLAVKAVDRMVELEAKRRKEDDPDASDIAKLGAEQRKELAKMQQISVGGVTMSAEEWSLLRDGLSNTETQAQVTTNMREKGYSDAAIEAGRHWATVLSHAAEWQEQHPGQALPPELQSQIDEYERQSPEIKTSTDEVRSQTIKIERGRASELTQSQNAHRSAAVDTNIENVGIVLASEGLDEVAIGYAEGLRSGSSESLTFLNDSREGPVITEAYNANAEGQTELAQAQELSLPQARTEMSLG